MLVLTGINLALLYRNIHRRLPPILTTEVLMLGTYVVTVVSGWLVNLLQGPCIGPWLILWTALVYLVTLVTRLRSPVVATPSSA
jgi:hypothetical protein